MDVRNWGLDEIMKLPDHLFGRRWAIRFCDYLSADETVRYMSPDALPERTVLWSINYLQVGAGYDIRNIRVALGDQEPVNDVIFNRFEPVCDVKTGIAGAGTIVGGAACCMYKLELRLPLVTVGRRFVVRFSNWGSSAWTGFGCDLVVSGIPSSIPDWSWWLRQKDFVGGRAGRA